jgi:ABC-type nitrate/sulfonate/bicarbonate transport system permease component
MIIFARTPVTDVDVTSAGIVADAVFRAPRSANVRLQQRLFGVAGIALIIFAWQLNAIFGWLPVQFVSSPLRVIATGVDMFEHGDLLHDIWVTLSEFFTGEIIAVAIAVPVGLIAGWYRLVRYVVEPYLAGLYATPSLALLPLLVLWCGIGMRSTIVLVVLSAFFPIVLNIMQGIKTVDRHLLRMGKSFGASQFGIFSQIVLPATAPFIASGLQLAVGKGLMGVIVGEMYASNGGLGYIISVAGSTLEVDQMFVAVSIITGLGILLIASARAFEHRMQRWKPKANDD